MAHYENLSDLELVALLREDEVAAFVEIYNRYWSGLYAAAYNRIREEEACKEIVQDVFTAFWYKRNVFTLQVGLSNYLYRAIKHQVIDYFRKQAIRRSFSNSLPLEAWDDSNQQSLLLKDLQRNLDRLVENLPDKCKSVYRMSRIENRSNKEIAKILDISEKTVEGHLTNALRQLRMNLSHFLVLVFYLFLK